MEKEKININLKKFIKIKRGINGLGLFTDIDIKKGEFIIEYWGDIISEKEANVRGGKYLFQTSSNRHVDGSTRQNIARYVNHSCRPNCETEIKRGQIFISSIKNIKKGEELFYDYGKEYWNEHIKPKGCNCPKCKK